MTLTRYGIHQGLDGLVEVYESLNGQFYKAEDVRAVLTAVIACLHLTVNESRCIVQDAYAETHKTCAGCRAKVLLTRVQEIAP